jgi:DNA-binding CsgD family transcriptional regulator
VVGRQAERERLVEILQPGLGTAGAVIKGAPGLGKTTLWREAVALGRRLGRRVLSCEPGARDAALPFAGLGDLLDDVAPERFDALPAPQRRALRTALYLDASGTAPSDRQAVGRGLLGLLRSLAAAEPLLLAVDDEQWLDPASARVLAFALPRLVEAPVTIVVAGRPDSSGVLGAELQRRLGDRLVTLALRPLDLGELRTLMAERLDRPPSGPALRRIHALSGGNPLYGLAIARRLAEAGDGDVPLPASLRDALAERLDRLDASAGPPLLAVAALRRASLPVLRAALPGFGLRDLDGAERAGIVAVSGEHVRFTHPLLASVHYARAGPGERRELHRRLAALVDDAEERAQHLALGADGPDEAIAAAIERAARSAAARAAPEAAAELLTQAAQLTPPGTARTERSLAAAELHHLTGDLPRARAVLAPLPGEAAEGETSARLHLLRARLCFDDLAESRRLLERALASAADDGRRAEIEFMLGEVHANLGDHCAAARHVARAVAAAERAGDRGRLAVALSQAGGMALFRGEGVQRDLMDRAIALEPHVRGMTHFYLPTTGLGCQLLWTEDAAAARALLEDVLRRGREAGYDDSGGERFFLAHACWLTGDIAAARRYAAEFELFAGESGDAQLDLYARYLRALTAWREGRLADVPAAAADAATVAEEAGDAFVAAAAHVLAAQTELALGRPQEALSRVTPVLAQLRASGVGLVGFFVLDAWACEAEALIATGGPAPDAIAAIARRGRRAGNPNAEAVAARLRGLAAAAAGDHAGALEQFARALGLHDRRPVPFEIGRTLLERGTVERRLRRKAAAKQTLEAALAVLEPIAAGWWAARARDELGRVGLRRAPPGGATAAQARVAELVANGLTNREIAERLHMSVRTVEAHLTHIYRDFGVRSRTQLTAALSGREGP